MFETQQKQTIKTELKSEGGHDDDDDVANSEVVFVSSQRLLLVCFIWQIQFRDHFSDKTITIKKPLLLQLNSYNNNTKKNCNSTTHLGT